MTNSGSDLSVAALLRHGEAILTACGSATPRLDAEILLAAAMQTERAGLYARLSSSVPAAVQQRFATALERRRRREPVAYITGFKEFRSLPFVVTPAVLIPRPETEHVVDVVAEMLHGRPHPLVCEIGTGSGCIAVSVAYALPTARVVATDLSRAAIEVARANAQAHHVNARVAFAVSDLFDGIAADARFDAIVSNPPYLAPSDVVSPEVDWEPRVALAAGADGLAVIRRLLAAVPAHLVPGGALVMELGQGQAETVVALAAAAGLTAASVRADLAGIPRVLNARRPSRA